MNAFGTKPSYVVMQSTLISNSLGSLMKAGFTGMVSFYAMDVAALFDVLISDLHHQL
jgi:hypothetical protein